MVSEQLVTIGSSMASAAVYSMVFYAKKRLSKDKQKLDIKKFLATVIVGAGVGAAFATQGVPINQASVGEKLAMYAGTVAIIESLLKSVFRILSNKV
jgi:hypothetical protein